MRHVPALLILSLWSSCAFTAEGVRGGAGEAVPGGGASIRQSSPAGMGSRLQGFDVEVLPIRPSDVAALARWAELAALGYHVVATVPGGDGAAVLYLERMQMGFKTKLPDAVELSPEVGATVLARIQAAQAERAQSQNGQRQPGIPGPAVPPGPPALIPSK